ncbi:SET domain-containing protein SmydA-8-like isoform X2 [Lycorma delicatula]
MLNSETNGNCVLCKLKGQINCSGCGVVQYCSLQHMKEHSSVHKPLCKSYIISKNEVFGRFIVASRNIKQGEIIFQEEPLVFGPGEESSVPICFSCGSIPGTICQICNVALICRPDCSGKFHSNLECKTYKKISAKLNSNNFLTSKLILPLRCILHLRNPENNWSHFFNLESHIEKRRDTQIWSLHHRNIVQVLQKWGIITMSKDDEEKVQEIMGILDVNSFEVRCGMQSQGRALFLEAAMMSHDCFPNSLVAVDNNFLMTIKARRDISAGQSITYNYTNILHNTITRREHLLETKYFLCSCERCKDPTELGTHLSSLLCSRCHKGFVVPNNEKDNWKCLQCSHEFTKGLINTTLHHIQYIIDDLNKNCMKDIENMLTKLSYNLAPNHSFIIDLKQQLAVLYRDNKPTTEFLDKRRKLCQDLLMIIEILEPGISRLRGIALYELHTITLGLAHLKHNDLQLMLDDEVILKEAVSLLLHEPPFSPEGALTRQAMSELKKLRDYLKCAEKKKNRKKK